MTETLTLSAVAHAAFETLEGRPLFHAGWRRRGLGRNARTEARTPRQEVMR
jgi:hypothetical protein